MFSYCIDSVRKDLAYQEQLLRNFTRRLDKFEKYNGCRLIASSSQHYMRYFLSRREAGKENRIYLGADKSYLINDLQEKEFLEKAIEICRENIECLTYLIQNYRTLTPDEISSGMSLAYNNPSQVQSLLFRVQRSNEWKKQALCEKSRFKPYKPKELKHHAIDGTMTRSKSEALIYNLLCAENYTFVYELPRYIGTKLLLPDFTIYDSTRDKLVIIEHMGMMPSGTYCEDQMEKLQTYIINGWVPNNNLLLTFDDINGNINTNSINKMIKAIMS